MCAYDFINNNVLIVIPKADFIFYLKQRTNGDGKYYFYALRRIKIEMIISSGTTCQNHRSGSSSIPPISPFRKELKGGVSFASVKSAANAPSRVAAVRRPPISANSVSRSTTDASGAVAWSRGYRVKFSFRAESPISKISSCYQSKTKFSFFSSILHPVRARIDF